MRLQGYCDVYKWTILKRTSPEVKCLHPTSSRREMCTSSVSNVIYHKFSHGAAVYTFNGKNVHVMLEYSITSKTTNLYFSLCTCFHVYGESTVILIIHHSLVQTNMKMRFPPFLQIKRAFATSCLLLCATFFFSKQ